MFWENYANLCEAVGKAPNVVAREVGIKSSGTVTGWRNGAMPRPGVLSKIADYFGVSVRDLIGEEKRKSTPGEGGGQDDDALVEDFRLWFRAQTPDRQKEVLFDLAKNVTGRDE